MSIVIYLSVQDNFAVPFLFRDYTGVILNLQHQVDLKTSKASELSLPTFAQAQPLRFVLRHILISRLRNLIEKSTL